jgi:hypothetical protein
MVISLLVVLLFLLAWDRADFGVESVHAWSWGDSESVGAVFVPAAGEAGRVFDAGEASDAGEADEGGESGESGDAEEGVSVSGEAGEAEAGDAGDAAASSAWSASASARLGLGLGPSGAVNVSSGLSISPDVVLPADARACVSSSQRLYSGFLSRAGYRMVRDEGSCHVQVRTAHHLGEEIPGDRLVSSLGFRTCVSGSKASQLSCRQALAHRAGCEVESSGLSPLQFDLGTVAACKRFVSWLEQEHEAASASSSSSSSSNKSLHLSSSTLWLEKPTDMDAHGRGQVLHRDMSLWRGRSCSRGVPRIMVEYIGNPATIGGRKFDVRTYVLVARTGPALVFYADGIGRLADVAYSLDSRDPKAHITNLNSQHGEDHKLTFGRLNELLALEPGFERGFFHGRFRARAQLISRYYVLSLIKGSDFDARRAARRWNLYGLDWVVDALGNSRLLEGNAFPLVASHPLGAKVYEHALELAIKLHASPEQLIVFAPDTAQEQVAEQVAHKEREQAEAQAPRGWERLTRRANFTFHEWSLIYNENEEPSPDVCGLIKEIKSTEVKGPSGPTDPTGPG